MNVELGQLKDYLKENDIDINYYDLVFNLKVDLEARDKKCKDSILIKRAKKLGEYEIIDSYYFPEDVKDLSLYEEMTILELLREVNCVNDYADERNNYERC